MDTQFYRTETLVDSQHQGVNSAVQGQSRMEWVGPLPHQADGTVVTNSNDTSAPLAEKPQLNLTNSLSSVFFSNIYNDVETSGVAHSSGSDTDKDEASADITSTLLQLMNETPAAPDMKSTPRCATPLDFNVNPLLFNEPATIVPAEHSHNRNSTTSLAFKNPQLTLPSHMTRSFATSTNSNEQYESLFAYLMSANQQVKTPTNDYYSIQTPIASDTSLSPYQRGRLGSGVSSGSGNSGSEDFLMLPTDSVSDATSVTYLDEHNLTKFNDFPNIDINMNDISNTNFSNYNNNNNTMDRDRLLSSFSEVEILTEELDEAVNEARLQLPISLPSQGTSFYLEGGETTTRTGADAEELYDASSSNDYQSNESNDECNDGEHCESDSEGENTNDDYNYDHDDDSDDSHSAIYNGNGDREVKRGVVAVKRARTYHRAKGAGSSTTAFSTSRAGSITISKCDKQFKCSKCASSFTRKTRLTEHVNRVHLGKIYHFKCNQCGTRLSSKENLTRHSIVHTDKFKCKKCNRRFDRSYRFQRHLEKCNMAHY